MCHNRLPYLVGALTGDTAESRTNAHEPRGESTSGTYEGFTAEERAAPKDRVALVQQAVS